MKKLTILALLFVLLFGLSACRCPKCKVFTEGNRIYADQVLGKYKDQLDAMGELRKIGEGHPAEVKAVPGLEDFIKKHSLSEDSVRIRKRTADEWDGLIKQREKELEE
jgi:hypothetical protein